MNEKRIKDGGGVEILGYLLTHYIKVREYVKIVWVKYE